MKVLISGSNGFIGSALKKRLTRSGHEVTSLVRSKPPPRSGDVGWDPNAGKLDLAAVEGFDAWVNLSGAGIGDRRWTAAHKAEVLDSRTKSSTLLARTAARLDHPPRILLNSSGIGYYGDRGDEKLTEQSTPGDGFLASVVRAWEESVRPAEEAGVRVVRTRSGLVLSPGGGILKRQAIPFRLGVGGKIGSGAQWVSWISLEDEIAAMIFLLELEESSGPYNLCAPNPVTNDELTAALGRILKRPTLLSVPAVAIKIALGAEMAGQLLLVSQRALPTRLLEAGFRFKHPEMEGALRSLLRKRAA